MLSTNGKHYFTTHFLATISVAITLTTATWYLYVRLWIYRKSWRILWRSPFPAVEAVETLPKSADVLGKVKTTDVSSLPDSEIRFDSEPEPDDEPEATIPRRPTDDLLDESKSLVDVFAETMIKNPFCPVKCAA